MAFLPTKYESERMWKRNAILAVVKHLIVTGDRTYAFTNQWGNRTLQAIDLLSQAFPDTEVSYVKSS
jgi:hypothetical protein